MMEKIILCLLGSIAWQASIASAGDLEKGIQFFEQKDYIKAMQLWQPLAKEGDARAQYNMALLFYKDKDNLKRKKANQYLAMSRSKGLIDGYFINIPVQASTATLLSNDAISAAESVRAQDSKAAVGTITVNNSMTWLDYRQKSNFTLQLATGKSRQSLESMQKKLIASQLLEQPDNLYVHKVEKSDQKKATARYVLIYGIFETYQDAKAEVAKLPDSIQKSSPWIRKFSDIQSIVNTEQRKKKT